MKKQRTSNQVVLFILVALMAGFIVGWLWPSEPEVVYIEESNVIKVVDAIGPSVVSIISDSSPDSFSATAGSGFIVSEEGLVVTNKHVVNDPETNYSVKLTDGRSFSVVEIHTHPTDDLAVLKLLDEDGNLPTDLPIVKLGDSDMIQTGQRVIAMGATSPEFDVTVSTGVISSIGRSIQAGDRLITEELMGVIETDAAIHPGDSGGPLINLNGEVIGVSTALDTTNGRISFAIPSNEVKNLVEYLN